MKDKKAFTLIELVSVLVILAILALIVTPLVLNIIRKARTAADKRSIDAYGRSIELAIADYLLDNGTFPTSIEELQVEYSGDRVVCSTTQLNSDSSVYLAECTVNSRAVTGYTYGKEEAKIYKLYNIGDVVEYKGVNFYVLADSENSPSVTLIKAEPIKSEEIESYLTSTEIVDEVNTTGTYARMAYYSGDNCSSSGDRSGCSSEYLRSDVKQVVDIWSNKLLGSGKEYEARLITVEEVSSLGYEWFDNGSVSWWNKTEEVPNWIYNENYSYWTMSAWNDSNDEVFSVGFNVVNGSNVMSDGPGYNSVYPAVRPVIVLSKSALN